MTTPLDQALRFPMTFPNPLPLSEHATPSPTSLPGEEPVARGGELDKARHHLARALERDPNSIAAWGLSERWTERAADKDERVYARHRQLALARAQGRDKAALESVRARLRPLDPAADALDKLRASFMARALGFIGGVRALPA
jgi:hypothetical protein